MQFHSAHYPYSSRRALQYAQNGMVATSNPLAAQAGLAILRQGGNAMDAAVAAAACLTVVEPASTGIGGDAFALIWNKGRLHGLNASGPAPRNLSAKVVRDLGHTTMPRYGWIPVTVPGTPSAWQAINQRFGSLSLEQVLAPAAAYARIGFPLGVLSGRQWEDGWKLLKIHLTDDVFRHWFQHFSIDGLCPKTGDIWRSEHTANTLEEIGQTKSESFYRGRLAQKILDFSNQTGGYLTAEDLSSFTPQWVDPIHVNYRGYDIWEIPPNGHGISVLMALRILSELSFPEGRESADTYHKQIEAMKLAFIDAKKYVADPTHMSVTHDQLLSESYAQLRRSLIGEHALSPMSGNPNAGDTVYLCTVDGEGNMVSYIQSNYTDFGSGLVVPETGIALHNRGNCFSLEEGHDNLLAGGKKPYHTIIPGFITKDHKPVGPFGVMGGFMQPQGHVQVVTNSIDFHMNPQAALDAPRWQWIGEKKIQIEEAAGPKIIQELMAKGHEVEVCTDRIEMGRGQIIWQMENGVYCGGTEPRADGGIAAY